MKTATEKKTPSTKFFQTYRSALARKQKFDVQLAALQEELLEKLQNTGILNKRRGRPAKAESTPSAPKRGPGRPRKEPTSVVPSVKSKRGRPKKVAEHRGYVPRVDSSHDLLSAVLSVMPPQKEMRMPDIVKALEKSGKYPTTSDYLYVMVNNKLNSQHLNLVGAIRRGTYIHQPDRAQLDEMAKYHQDKGADVEIVPAA